MNPRPRNGRLWRVATLIAVFCTALGLPAFAQTDTGGIEGVVRDSSGAVLPGVTVEVSSSALIERTRTATTEDTGNYRFLRLPVGSYVVKFSLAGFTSVERREIVINSGFTATINAELSLGTLSESITVTGESPLVDVRATTTQYVITSEVANTLPSSRNVFDMGKFMVGFSTGVPEVGGSRSQNYGDGWQIHGSRGTDRSYYRDGLPASSYFGGGDAPMSYGGTGANEEINYQTTAIPASVQIGGVAMMLVTKSGGNQVSGTVFASGANKAMQSSNLDDKLRARGVRATSGGTKAYDVDTGIGGPIKKDHVWYFGDARVWSYTELLANQFGLDGKQMESYVKRTDYFGKATWQVNRNNKITFADSREGIYRPYRREGATFVNPEAANFNTQNPYNYFFAGTWTATPSNNWIYEVRASKMNLTNRERYRPEVGPNDVARLDITNSILSGAPTRIREGNPFRQVISGQITRVGEWFGGHELSAGAQYDWGGYITERAYHGDIYLRFRGSTPDSADLLNSPVKSDNRVRQTAFYVQDRWMIANRLTINAGARFDDTFIWFPDQYSPAGVFVPERRTPKTDVKDWKSVVPRLGVAYDLTGNQKTVLKGSFSKYMGNEATGLAENVNPHFFDSSNRCVWTDRNGDLYAQASELTACTGWSGGGTTVVDPNLRRPFNREYSLGIEHSLSTNLRLAVMFNRREQRDQRTNLNRAVPYDSYIPVVITNPLTNQPLTIYNQNPATAGRQDNILTNSSKLDTNYNGVEISFQRRFARGSQVQGGYHYGKNLGRIASGELNDPNSDIFAYGAVGTDEPHQFKLSGNHTLPYRVTLSGSFTTNSGHPRQRTLNVGRALVPTLTRATQTVRLERNDESRYDKWVQLDLRVGRTFSLAGWRVEPFLDGYNLLNANTVLTEVTTIGTSLGNVSQTINPRLLRVGGKVTF
ncbi:MAG TPA: TonB-dependent receptor [Vicinamibacterales bacterium]|nr:TonB-dependent receptor [Vicinamibacterales bacterium]